MENRNGLTEGLQETITVPPPKYLYIILTTKCNLRCKQCLLWTLSEDETKVSIKDRLRLIREFHELNSNGRIIITGGEPLTDPDQFFMLTSLCRDLGLFCAINTNGTYLDSKIVPRVFVEGPNHFVISLDSHLREMHDHMRGVQGTYDTVIRSIRQLTGWKDKYHQTTDVQVLTHTIISNKNIHLWKDYIEFARELGVDGVMFSILERSYLVRNRRDFFYEENSLSDKISANRHIDEIIKLYGEDPFIINKVTDLEMMKLYIDTQEYSQKQVCDSFRKNVMVDVNGYVQLCFSMREILEGQTLGNIQDKQLRDMWYSEIAIKARNIMKSCRRRCGINDCHRQNGKLY